ncbi:19932_t:CDS:2, partial [Funneliformis geosporum]
LATLVFLHWVFIYTHPSSSFSKPWTGLLEPETNGEVLIPPQHAKQIGKAKACFVILIRNHDLHEFRWTMRQLEDRFNKKYNYPYVFLNEAPFTEEFKKLSSALTKAKTEYDINMDTVNKNMAKMKEDNVIYGDSLSYRHMCRHELLDKYDFYWRVEPGVQFFCDIDFDPFMYLKENDIKYSFTISLYEYEKTIPTLWDSVKEFMKKYPQYIEKDNSIDFISDDNGDTYNLCHFWSNFELADLNFLRSEAYMKYFDFLDKKGGFFYERWGDAPVHSIAAALLLKRHQIHFFNEIGYKHDPFMHCPIEESLQMKCHCDPNESFVVPESLY